MIGGEALQSLVRFAIDMVNGFVRRGWSFFMTYFTRRRDAILPSKPKSPSVISNGLKKPEHTILTMMDPPESSQELMDPSVIISVDEGAMVNRSPKELLTTDDYELKKSMAAAASTVIRKLQDRLLKRRFSSCAGLTGPGSFTYMKSKKAKLDMIPKANRGWDKKKKKAVKAENNEGDEETGESYSRPNYFVAFRITSEEIRTKIRQVQEEMIQKSNSDSTDEEAKQKKNDNVFKQTIVAPDKLHCTLHVMHLKTDDHLSKAKEALEKVYLKICEEHVTKPIQFPVKGLGHFRNSVLFAKIHGDEHIKRVHNLSAVVREEFELQGFAGDSKAFQPHMTIAKLSKGKKLYKKKIRSFPRHLWNDHESTHFGYQKVESIELLSMMETDTVTKYYKCVARFSLVEEGKAVKEDTSGSAKSPPESKPV